MIPVSRTVQMLIFLLPMEVTPDYVPPQARVLGRRGEPLTVKSPHLEVRRYLPIRALAIAAMLVPDENHDVVDRVVGHHGRRRRGRDAERVLGFGVDPGVGFDVIDPEDEGLGRPLALFLPGVRIAGVEALAFGVEATDADGLPSRKILRSSQSTDWSFLPWTKEPFVNCAAPGSITSYGVWHAPSRL